MHELSIVMSIVDIAEEEVKKAQAHHVDAIELEIGTLAGVEMEALYFTWPAAVKNTVLENADRVINEVQAVGLCTHCGCEFKIHEPYQPCPACNNLLIRYLKGKELKVKALTVS